MQLFEYLNPIELEFISLLETNIKIRGVVMFFSRKSTIVWILDVFSCVRNLRCAKPQGPLKIEFIPFVS